MVRRKSTTRGLVNQPSTMSACPLLLTSAGWLTPSPPYASNCQQLQWQQQQRQAQSLICRCNELSGCTPRQTTVPQPAVSSRKLGSSQTNWMSQRLQAPQGAEWYRAASERQRAGARALEVREPARQLADFFQPARQIKRQQQQQNLQQRHQLVQQQPQLHQTQFKQQQQQLQLQQPQLKQLQQQLMQQEQQLHQQQHYQHQQQQLQQEQQPQLKQQRHSLQQQQQLMQHQQQLQQQQLLRWQQPAVAAAAAIAKHQNSFYSFNFGICAEHCIRFHDSESQSSLYSATHPDETSDNSNSDKTLTTPQTPLEHCENYSYVQTPKQLSEQKPVRSPTDNASTTTLTNTPVARADRQKEDCDNARTSSLRSSEESLNQVAMDIDLNLSAIRRLLEVQLPQRETMPLGEKELDKLASELSLRIGVNSKPGVHLEGGEQADQTYQLQKEPQSDQSPKELQNSKPAGTTAKSSHERQLNLNKLFRQQSESNPMWQSLMQLAAGMVEHKDESKDKPPKQYSIYLMVSSDDENDTESDDKGAELLESHCSNLHPSRLSYKMGEDLLEPKRNLYQWQQTPEVPKRKRRLSRKQREKEASLNPLLPPRRPLHWPKQDYSKPASKSSKKSKKLPRCDWWATQDPNPPQPLRKYQYR